MFIRCYINKHGLDLDSVGLISRHFQYDSIDCFGELSLKRRYFGSEEIFKLLDARLWSCARMAQPRWPHECGHRSRSGATLRIKSCQSKDYCYSLYVAAESTCLQRHGTRSVLDTAVTAVHFVKSRALRSHLFGELCWNMDAQHKRTTIVQWLSYSNVSQQVFEPSREMAEFMRERKPNSTHFFTDPKFAYLADIFDILNNLNLSIQGGHCLHEENRPMEQKDTRWNNRHVLFSKWLSVSTQITCLWLQWGRSSPHLSHHWAST